VVRHQYEHSTAEQVGLGLGWFSIALGLSEIAMPGTLARATGLSHDRRARQVMRAMGAREIAHGLAILSRPGQPGPVWSRVAGDGLDVALFAAGVRRPGGHVGRAAGGAAFLAMAGLADMLCRRYLGPNALPAFAAQYEDRSRIVRCLAQSTVASEHFLPVHSNTVCHQKPPSDGVDS
jgi:hypothetical protein